MLGSDNQQAQRKSPVWRRVLKHMRGNNAKQQQQQTSAQATTGSKRDLLRIELPEHYGPSHKTLSGAEKQAMSQMKNAEDAITMLKKVCNAAAKLCS